MMAAAQAETRKDKIMKHSNGGNERKTELRMKAARAHLQGEVVMMCHNSTHLNVEPEEFEVATAMIFGADALLKKEGVTIAELQEFTKIMASYRKGLEEAG